MNFMTVPVSISLFLLTVFNNFQQASNAICTKLSTLDQVHCSHCPLLWTSDDAKPVCLCLVFMAGFTNPCLIVCSSKFSKSSIPYYANTTSCFNIILAGDIELNPRPETSGSTTACNKKPSSDTCFQVYLQNVTSPKTRYPTQFNGSTSTATGNVQFLCFD